MTPTTTTPDQQKIIERKIDFKERQLNQLKIKADEIGKYISHYCDTQKQVDEAENDLAITYNRIEELEEQIFQLETNPESYMNKINKQ